MWVAQERQDAAGVQNWDGQDGKNIMQDVRPLLKMGRQPPVCIYRRSNAYGTNRSYNFSGTELDGMPSLNGFKIPYVSWLLRVCPARQ